MTLNLVENSFPGQEKLESKWKSKLWNCWKQTSLSCFYLCPGKRFFIRKLKRSNLKWKTKCLTFGVEKSGTDIEFCSIDFDWFHSTILIADTKVFHTISITSHTKPEMKVVVVWLSGLMNFVHTHNLCIYFEGVIRFWAIFRLIGQKSPIKHSGKKRCTCNLWIRVKMMALPMLGGGVSQRKVEEESTETDSH